MVLVSLSAVGGWSVFAHELDHHDADHLPGVVVHDASAHVFTDAGLPAGERPVHCVLCHWTRAFGPGLESVSLGQSLASRTLAAHAADDGLVHRVASVQPPLRAPPAAPPVLHFFA